MSSIDPSIMFSEPSFVCPVSGDSQITSIVGQVQEQVKRSDRRRSIKQQVLIDSGNIPEGIVRTTIALFDPPKKTYSSYSGSKVSVQSSTSSSTSSSNISFSSLLPSQSSPSTVNQKT